MADIATPARPRFNPWPATVFVSLCVLAALFVAPTVGVLLSSVKTTRAIAFGDLWSIPDRIHTGNYTEVLSNPAVHRYFLNTLIVTVPATVASTALGVLAGHVFAKLPFRGSDALFLVAAFAFKAQPIHLDQLHYPTLPLDVDFQIPTPLKGELIYLMLISVAIDNGRLERGRDRATGRYP